MVKMISGNPVLQTLVVVVLVNLIFFGIALIVAWPAVNASILFILGGAALVLGYLLDMILFSRYDFTKNRRRPNLRELLSRSKLQQREVSAQYQAAASESADPEIARARKWSTLLMNISLAGAIAMVVSLFLPQAY